MFSQFDLSNWLRCSATDPEGFRCMKQPSHPGGHRWSRCDWADARGARCMLPPKHPGRHELLWYDRPAVPGDTRTIAFDGTEVAATPIADKAARVWAGHGWVEVSRRFERSLPWRLPAVSPLLELLGEPRGRVAIVFEYRPGARLRTESAADA